MILRESSVAQISDLLADTKNSEPKACLLIGAGVSYTAGIGLAKDFIKRIKAEYPAIYDAACRNCAGSTPSYAECMAQLPPATQVKLVRTDIDAAKTNWAHIGIARLERASVVDTILTPNFDPLASRACALFNRFPAIYDLAGLRDEAENHISFDKSFVKGSAIFHLHGQHTGFLLLNTEAKLINQAKRIRPVLDAVMKGKPVIIAGYSGENDPLIDQIAALAPFNHGLFWICRDDKDPAENVVEKLLSLENCYVVRDMPSDKFFTELANTLKLEPPSFLATPFEHMLSVIDTVRPHSDIQSGGVGDDLLAQAREQLRDASSSQNAKRPERANIATLMSAGRYNEVFAQYGENFDRLDDEDRELVAWSAIEIGTELANKARARNGSESDALFEEANEKYRAALQINPGMHEALNNWGGAIGDHAEKKKGREADSLFAEACEKYRQSISTKPDKHEAYNNWGVTLLEQARTKSGSEKDEILSEADDKFSKCIEINPANSDAYQNWGNSLAARAITRSGEDACALFDDAIAKYSQALDIDPERHDTLNNWGAALTDYAAKKLSKQEKVDLLQGACEKLEAAIALKPDRSDSFNNWGNTLSTLAELYDGDESDGLFRKAGEKFSAALAIKPGLASAYCNWGTALLVQGERVAPHVARRLFQEAYDKFSSALSLDREMHEALTNWGNALASHAEIEEQELSDALFQQAYEKYQSASDLRPENAKILSNWGSALSEQASGKEGEEAMQLFAQSIEKFEFALSKAPDNVDILNNYGAVLSKRASLTTGQEASDLFEKAVATLKRGEALGEGECAYNLACVYALMGEIDESCRWLRVSKHVGKSFPGCHHLLADKDFSKIEGTKEFADVLKEIGC